MYIKKVSKHTKNRNSSYPVLTCKIMKSKRKKKKVEKNGKY